VDSVREALPRPFAFPNGQGFLSQN
jgi:hypothetical protein